MMDVTDQLDRVSVPPSLPPSLPSSFPRSPTPPPSFSSLYKAKEERMMEVTDQLDRCQVVNKNLQVRGREGGEGGEGGWCPPF